MSEQAAAGGQAPRPLLVPRVAGRLRLPCSPRGHQQGVTLGVLPCTLRGLWEGRGTHQREVPARRNCFNVVFEGGMPGAPRGQCPQAPASPPGVPLPSAAVSCPLGRSFPRTQSGGGSLCPADAPALPAPSSVGSARGNVGGTAVPPGSPRPLPPPGIELIVFPQWVTHRLGCSHGGGRGSGERRRGGRESLAPGWACRSAASGAVEPRGEKNTTAAWEEPGIPSPTRLQKGLGRAGVRRGERTDRGGKPGQRAPSPPVCPSVPSSRGQLRNPPRGARPPELPQVRKKVSASCPFGKGSVKFSPAGGEGLRLRLPHPPPPLPPLSRVEVRSPAANARGLGLFFQNTPHHPHPPLLPPEGIYDTDENRKRTRAAVMSPGD